MKWEKIGEVGVDSGQLMVCDPCYIESQWKKGTEPAGHPYLVLTEKGKKKFLKLRNFKVKWPFSWGSYVEVCPELGISINDAIKNKLVEEIKEPLVQEFSYRGVCSVARRQLEGSSTGQLNYIMGHAGAGVAFCSGYGDGVYPVYARRNSDGRIVEVKIVME